MHELKLILENSFLDEVGSKQTLFSCAIPNTFKDHDCKLIHLQIAKERKSNTYDKQIMLRLKFFTNIDYYKNLKKQVKAFADNLNVKLIHLPIISFCVTPCSKNIDDLFPVILNIDVTLLTKNQIESLLIIISKNCNEITRECINTIVKLDYYKKILNQQDDFWKAISKEDEVHDLYLKAKKIDLKEKMHGYFILNCGMCLLEKDFFYKAADMLCSILHDDCYVNSKQCKNIINFQLGNIYLYLVASIYKNCFKEKIHYLKKAAICFLNCYSLLGETGNLIISSIFSQLINLKHETYPDGSNLLVRYKGETLQDFIFSIVDIARYNFLKVEQIQQEVQQEIQQEVQQEIQQEVQQEIQQETQQEVQNKDKISKKI